MSIRRTVSKLVVVSVLMFGFGFALVPLYQVFCDVTGINGKTSDSKQTIVNVKPDTSRKVTVQFLTTTNDGMPWQFSPITKSIDVSPGKTYKIQFYAKNTTTKEMVGQAVPSVSPGLAAKYFKKAECFCFTQQTLAAGQAVDMPLVFMLDPELPKQYTKITLAYTLFDATGIKPVTGKRLGRL